MSKINDVMTGLVESYFYDADGWSPSYIRKHAGDFYAESGGDVADSLDDDDLIDVAENSYSGSRDWPQSRSIRQGLVALASDAMYSDFQSAVESALDGFDDFEALFKTNPYHGQEPDADYGNGVRVYWDEDHHVAIKTVQYNGRDFYLDVSGEYDFEEDALLQLKRSAHGQEDGGGGDEEAA